MGSRIGFGAAFLYAALQGILGSSTKICSNGLRNTRDMCIQGIDA